MTTPAAKFGSAATAAPVNCAPAEVFDNGTVEVVTVGVIVGEAAGGGLDLTAAGVVVIGGGDV